MAEIITPSQTIGPFFAYGLAPKGRAHWDPNGSYSWKETIGDNLVTPDASGEKILIEGRVTDGDGPKYCNDTVGCGGACCGSWAVASFKARRRKHL